MAKYKCTWFFEGIQSNTEGITASAALGWTETWYAEFGNIEAALQQMRLTGNVTPTYLGRRIACLHPLYRCVWVRASEVLNPRNTKTAPLATNVRGQAPTPAAGAGSASQINCAVLVDFVAPSAGAPEPNHHRRFLIRGLPSELVMGNLIDEKVPSFTALQRFCDVVGRGQAPLPVGGVEPPPSQWLLRFEAANQPKVPITALEIDANRNILVTSALGNLFQGQRVTITRAKGIRGLNRNWSVLQGQASPGPYQMGRSRFDLAGVLEPGAVAQKVVPDFRAANQYTIIGLRNKKTGVPFHLTRGRRRVL